MWLLYIAKLDGMLMLIVCVQSEPTVFGEDMICSRSVAVVLTVYRELRSWFVLLDCS